MPWRSHRPVVTVLVPGPGRPISDDLKFLVLVVSRPRAILVLISGKNRLRFVPVLVPFSSRESLILLVLILSSPEDDLKQGPSEDRPKRPTLSGWKFLFWVKSYYRMASYRALPLRNKLLVQLHVTNNQSLVAYHNVQRVRPKMCGTLNSTHFQPIKLRHF